jgi:pimeloyl-ACP methyl ester carboxylesterase
MTEPRYLETDAGRRIAYHRFSGREPGVVFLGGLRSDMTGTKAVHLEDWARRSGRAFLRFDYSGHGASSGDFTEGCIGDWAEDAEAAITTLTEGPVVLVGSSMGGWISLLMARRMPEKVAGLVTIAAAPDFTEDGMWAEWSEEQRTACMEEGQVALPSEYGEDMVITRRMIEDGRMQLVLRTPLTLDLPVRMLQGTADAMAAIGALTEGPQVLVGSSMGGWIALLCARAMPERLAGLVTIAAAPDFTEDAMWEGFDAAQRAELAAEGQVALPSDYGEPYIITRRLIEDGRAHLVLREPLTLPFAVRFLQGTADEDVAVSVALRLLEHATGPDMRLTLVDGADHRFSDPECLRLIERSVEEVLERAGSA